MSLYVDDMILQIENPKDSTQKLPEVINKFSILAGHKTTFGNQLHFCLLTMKIQYILKLQPKNIKCLEINVTKEVKGFYAENYKILIEGIKEDSKEWIDIPYS